MLLLVRQPPFLTSAHNSPPKAANKGRRRKIRGDYLPPRLTFPHNFSRRVKVESRVGPLPTDLADGAIRARAFSIRVVHHLCVPDSLPTGRSFPNIARCSSLRRFLPS